MIPRFSKPGDTARKPRTLAPQGAGTTARSAESLAKPDQPKGEGLSFTDEIAAALGDPKIDAAVRGLLEACATGLEKSGAGLRVSHEDATELVRYCAESNPPRPELLAMVARHCQPLNLAPDMTIEVGHVDMNVLDFLHEREITFGIQIPSEADADKLQQHLKSRFAVSLVIYGHGTKPGVQKICDVLKSPELPGLRNINLMWARLEEGEVALLATAFAKCEAKIEKAEIALPECGLDAAAVLMHKKGLRELSFWIGSGEQAEKNLLNALCQPLKELKKLVLPQVGDGLREKLFKEIHQPTVFLGLDASVPPPEVSDESISAAAAHWAGVEFERDVRCDTRRVMAPSGSDNFKSLNARFKAASDAERMRAGMGQPWKARVFDAFFSEVQTDLPRNGLAQAFKNAELDRFRNGEAAIFSPKDLARVSVSRTIRKESRKAIRAGLKKAAESHGNDPALLKNKTAPEPEAGRVPRNQPARTAAKVPKVPKVPKAGSGQLATPHRARETSSGEPRPLTRRTRRPKVEESTAKRGVPRQVSRAGENTSEKGELDIAPAKSRSRIKPAETGGRRESPRIERGSQPVSTRRRAVSSKAGTGTGSSKKRNGD